MADLKAAASGLLVLGLVVGAAITLVAVPSRTITATETLILVPVIHTQVETITSQTTGVETLTFTLTETSLTTVSQTVGSMSSTTLQPYDSTPAEGYYLPVGTLFVAVRSSTMVVFFIMNSQLYQQYQNGQSVPICFSSNCNLDQDGASVGVSTSTIYFTITTAGTYYTWVSNDYTGNSTASVSWSLGIASQQTVTYSITSTLLSTTTGFGQTVTTLSNTTYSTSTVG